MYSSQENNNSFNNSNSNKNNGNKHKPLRVYVGDMVKVIDSGSPLFGKFGLVEKVCPHNQEWQVMVKIGPESHRTMFKQLRFCTRINKQVCPNEVNGNKAKVSSKISDYIDEVNEEEDNKYNR